MIQKQILVNLIITSVFSGLVYSLTTPQQAANCFLGGGLMALNLTALIWAFRKIFQKKSVALAITVIVSKYAALIGLFVFLYSYGWRPDWSFLLGTTALIPTLAYLGFKQTHLGEENGAL